MNKLQNLPSPKFESTPNITKFLAGIRPYRETTYRLEKEKIKDKLVIHNYGHGGAGITLSWGCAIEVKELISKYVIGNQEENEFRCKPDKSCIAIIGCGVMGLTTAVCLMELGHKVTIYAKDTPPNTTSNIAGGQWNPSSVAFRAEETEQFHRILRQSFRKFESLIGDEYGVSRKTNFTLDNKGSFELVPRDIIPEPRYYKKLPFEGHDDEGYSYETLLIEPPIFLDKLVHVLRKNGVNIIQKQFSNSHEILGLSENVIINCTGYGAKMLWNDDKVTPIKGQLALLDSQNDLDYLYSGNGYIFPRKDYVILGGTYQRGEDDPTPDEGTCLGIIDWHKDNFNPKLPCKFCDLKELYKTDRILK